MNDRAKGFYSILLQSAVMDDDKLFYGNVSKLPLNLFSAVWAMEEAVLTLRTSYYKASGRGLRTYSRFILYCIQEDCTATLHRLCLAARYYVKHGIPKLQF